VGKDVENVNKKLIDQESKAKSFQKTMSENYTYLNGQNKNLTDVVTEFSDKMSGFETRLTEEYLHKDCIITMTDEWNRINDKKIEHQERIL